MNQLNALSNRVEYDEHSLKVRRKLANLNPDYLETLILQPAPLT